MRHFIAEDEIKLIELYNKGFENVYIAKRLGFSERSVRKHINQLRDAGVLSYTKCKSTYHPITKDKKERKEAEMIIARITDLYNSDVPIEEIARSLGLSITRTRMCINDLIQAGILKYKDIYKKNTTRKPRSFKRIRESTLQAGGTIECTEAVAKTCIYGCDTASKGLCNYFGITGELRSQGEGKCSCRACTKYSKVSRSNPRLTAN